MSIRYLTLEEALAVIDRRELGPVRDVGLLDAAINRPAASAFGQDAYPTLLTKAAALLHSLTKNHALVDGNKRAAWHLTRLFLGINDVFLVMSDDEAVELILDVTTDVLDDVPKISARMAPHLT